MHDGFLVARKDGRDWTCERLVVTRDEVRVAWTAPEWLAPGANARFDASYFTRIAPMLSERQPLVLLLPAPDKGAPWITRVELNGDRTPVAQDWFDEDLPATIVDDELSYFSFVECSPRRPESERAAGRLDRRQADRQPTRR